MHKHWNLLNQDLFTYIFIPPLYLDNKYLTPNDYHIKEVFPGKPTMDTTKLMVTIGIKEVFNHLEQDEFELLRL